MNIITDMENYQVVLYVNEDLLGEVKDQNDYSNFIKIFPNPSNGIVSFNFNSGPYHSMKLSIYNSVGTRIKHHEVKNPSDYNKLLIWNGTNENNIKVSPGTYYYRVTSDEFQESGKIILLD